jgi:hypothetical protein
MESDKRFVQVFQDNGTTMRMFVAAVESYDGTMYTLRHVEWSLPADVKDPNERFTALAEMCIPCSDLVISTYDLRVPVYEKPSMRGRIVLVDDKALGYVTYTHPSQETGHVFELIFDVRILEWWGGSQESLDCFRLMHSISDNIGSGTTGMTMPKKLYMRPKHGVMHVNFVVFGIPHAQTRTYKPMEEQLAFMKGWRSEKIKTLRMTATSYHGWTEDGTYFEERGQRLPMQVMDSLHLDNVPNMLKRRQRPAVGQRIVILDGGKTWFIDTIRVGRILEGLEPPEWMVQVCWGVC